MANNSHFRRIPSYIERELHSIQSQHIVVAAIITPTKADIARGAFRNLGLRLDNGMVLHPEFLSPDDLSGLYARRNRNGIIWKLTNLPKVSKMYSIESPNFGDPSKGYHTTCWSRMVYQRRLEPPRDWEFILSTLSEQEDRIRIKIAINAILNRQHPDFKRDLFFAINLLQEQCHNCHVFDAEVTDEELARITTVGWEIFPPGTRENTLSIIFSRMRNKSPERRHEITSRMDVLEGFHPTGHIVGYGMNSRYFGAQFGENIVAFENADYGNALYILFDNWREISQMSRIDILKRHYRDFIRIIHKKVCESALKRQLNDLLKS